MGNLERERLSRAWSMLDTEERSIASTWDSLLMEAGRGSSDIWRLNRRVEDIMEDLRNTLCDNCRDKDRVHEREQPVHPPPRERRKSHRLRW